ncbi:serine hydrolase [Kribbella sp. NPDC003557]|uniref:serine hydrolase n=1 Tax=Kribbella sp. NPDC003557 TaxID=3154449 RepID=UPI0033BE5D74
MPVDLGEYEKVRAMEIAERIRSFGPDDVGVWIGRLDGAAVFEHRAAELHYAASTMKLPLAMAVMRQVEAGDLSLDQLLEVHDDFESQVGGRFRVDREDDDAPATWTQLGSEVSLAWLVSEMITVSSNLATNLVLEVVGVDRAHAALGQFGDRAGAIRRGIDDAAARAAGITNDISPAGLAAALRAVGNQAGASGSYLRDLLSANQWNDEIPARLPAGTRVEHKNGWAGRSLHDGGIVYPPDAEPYCIVVCTTSDASEQEAQRLIADISWHAWNHRHDLAL